VEFFVLPIYDTFVNSLDKRIAMKKVFWDNSYQTKLNTSVVTVNGNEILFAETIAYSFSGGQESDKCMVNNLSVLDSRKEDNLIYYTLPDNHGLSAGDAITMEIDWPRRYRLMRLHFAAELILEIVTQQFSFEKIGAHIAEHKARIDFIAPGNISQHFDAILEAYNDIIAADKKIETGYIDVASQKRFWKIDGFAQVPCGGTHVKSTMEVGYATLKRVGLGKSRERIDIKLVDDLANLPK
jgi:Ser-tRNA(Ala) deacylase AlaX